jgi:ABC-2 type transport system ATP-binding protein
MSALLELENLTKDYGRFRALDNLTLSIQSGEVIGLLGPNGSGKTTALRMILGFMRPSFGHAKLAGYDCWQESLEVRKRVTYLPGELRLYETMTGRQLVKFLGQLRGEDPGAEVDRLAKRLDIDPDRPLTQMSSGMKRKIALMTVLVPKVPLIILDEPTNTLDPTMRDELLDQLKLAKSEGKAVLFSSHVLQEVEAVCDRVAILRRGQLVHLEPLVNLREGRHVSGVWRNGPPASTPSDTPVTPDPRHPERTTMDYRGPLPELLAWLAQQPVDDLRVEPLSLTPIYRKYHG